MAQPDSPTAQPAPCTADPKVLTFDVVGTLIDFESGMLSYLRRVGASARRRGGCGPT